MKPFANVRAVWITKWSYPYSEGEAAFYQSMKWGLELGMEVIWLSFYNSRNLPFTSLDYRTTPFGGLLIHVPGGFSPANLEAWLHLIQPTLVHQQGPLKHEILQVCKKMNLPVVSGFHFWTDAIVLSPIYQNKDMVKHLSQHKKDPKLDIILQQSVLTYVASDFMQDMIQSVSGVKIPHILYPTPDLEDCLALSTSERKYVTMINIHRSKGGEYFLHMINELLDIPFYAVQTDPYSEDLDAQIKKAIELRNANPNAAHCKYTSRIPNVGDIYAETKIIVIGSQIDEAFGRVAIEALANGIPVITTGKGNLKNILSNACLLVGKEKSEWTTAVSALYKSGDMYHRFQELSLHRYKLLDKKVARDQFEKIFDLALQKRQATFNVMFFTPWCDQSTGIQCRNYVDLLERRGINTCVFAFAPYWKSDHPKNQKAPIEWEHPRIFYSEHIREKVTDEEILKFISMYKITHCIMPETCYFRVFEIAELLTKQHVTCYAIPNLKMIRKKEIWKHHTFKRIWSSSHVSKETFEMSGFSNVDYLGYLPPKVPPTKFVNHPSTITFLTLGGHEAFTRKHMLMILEAFIAAVAQREQEQFINPTIPSIRLILSVQNVSPEEEEALAPYRNNRNITFHIEHLSRHDIEKCYHEANIVIQLAKYQGLGLIFYESLFQGCPVITMDAPPNNEIIKDKVNGRLIPAIMTSTIDFHDGLLESITFNKEDLTCCLLEVSRDVEETEKLIRSCKEYVTTNLDYRNFSDRFVSLLD